MNELLQLQWHELTDKLRGFILRRVGDEHETEDILQDVFLKLAKAASNTRIPQNLEAWLFLVARNAIIDRHRTRRQTVEVPEDLSPDQLEEDGEVAELKSAFLRMIRSLPEKYREAIELTEIEGISQVELAQRLGISVSGAKSRVQRGREMLKQMLLDCCEFEFDRRGRVMDCTPRSQGCQECSPARGERSGD